MPWQNPQTGAGGNITPLATSYSEGGLPCRDFLASYVHGAAQDWLQGAACRTASGAWEVDATQAAQAELKRPIIAASCAPIRLLHCVTSALLPH